MMGKGPVSLDESVSVDERKKGNIHAIFSVIKAMNIVTDKSTGLAIA